MYSMGNFTLLIRTLNLLPKKESLFVKYCMWGFLQLVAAVSLLVVSELHKNPMRIVVYCQM